MRPRTVRAKIVCLLMVPVVSLLALWAYATVSTAQDVSRLRQSQRVDSEVRSPVAAAVAALQAERSAAVRYATAPDAEQSGDLKRLAASTDREVSRLRLGDDDTVADGEELLSRSRPTPGGVRHRSRATALTAGPDVLAHRAGWDETYGQYTKTISTAFSVGGALSGVQDAELGSDARVLLEFSRAGESLSQEDVLLAGARLDGRLDGERLRLFVGAVDTRRTLTDSAVADLSGSEHAAWQKLADTSAYDAIGTVEDRVLGTTSGTRAIAAAPESTWNSAHARVQDGMRAIEADAGSGGADSTDPFTRGLLSSAGAAVLLGLAAVIASLVISVRIGRGLVVELVSLRNDALGIARHKLPEAMRRLRAGRRSTSARRPRPGHPRRTRPDRSPRPWAPCTAPPCGPQSNAPNSPAASPGSSSTSPAAARSWCTVNSACWTAWNAAPRTRTN